MAAAVKACTISGNPSPVPSLVGGSIADCGGELTGPVATNNPMQRRMYGMVCKRLRRDPHRMRGHRHDQLDVYRNRPAVVQSQERNPMREWLLADPRHDIDDIVELADTQYGPETEGILTKSPSTLRRHATITSTVQLFDKAKEFLAVCRSFDDPDHPDGKLLGFCWFDRGGYATYSMDEISNSKFHFVDLTLSPRLRIALINEMIDQHILWAGNCGIPVVCSTSIRMDHKAFAKIHERRGFTINGSYAWIRTTKGLEWLRSQNSSAPQVAPQT